MKKIKGNKGLLDQSRFVGMERERIRRLRNLSWKKRIKLAEDMLVCPLIDEWRNNSPQDHPVCLKMLLKKRRKP
jgi:hypothetical protein